MTAAAIICEYNPFHEGHRHQLRQLRARLGPEAALVCLMSGNYVQRGEPAVYDKWARAHEALSGGADLVLELPLTGALHSAGRFADMGVDCIRALGTVDYLSFGSEAGDEAALLEAARLLGSPEFGSALRETLGTGISYPAARQRALVALGGDGSLLASPNSALGIEYLRRLLETGSPIRPIVIRREAGMPSATALRETLRRENAPIHTLEHGERAILAILRTLPDEAFQNAPFGSEGLWSKVMKACRREASLEGILAACKSKRYTMSRLKRMLLCLYLGLSGEDMDRPVPYLRVLSFNDRGRALLRTCKETASLPLITGDVPDTPEARAYFALECRATDLYTLCSPPGASTTAGMERIRGPVKRI